MKNKINGILTATILAASGSVALADGHYNGQGFSSVVSSKTIEGKYKGVKALPTFQTTFQIDATHSIYNFKW